MDNVCPIRSYHDSAEDKIHLAPCLGTSCMCWADGTCAITHIGLLSKAINDVSQVLNDIKDAIIDVKSSLEDVNQNINGVEKAIRDHNSSNKP